MRPILNKWHPHTKKITYWFPSFFLFGLIASLVLLIFGINWGIIVYGIYFILSFVISLITTKNLPVALVSLLAIIIQFLGYGYGFIRSNFKLLTSNKEAEKVLPEFFFKLD